MKKNLSPWGKAVKIALIKKDWGVKDLAEETGMTKEYISSVISGRVISDKSAKMISDILNIEQEYLKKRPAEPWLKAVKITLVNRGWGIKELAEAVGATKSLVYAIINGRVISEDVAKKISEALGVEHQYLSSTD